MASASINATIDAPVDRVWAVMSDFGGVVGDLIERCDMEGEGVGAVRTLTLRGSGAIIKERLDARDAAAHTYSYAIVNDGECPLPVRNYSATVRLSDAGGGKTRVDWSGKFEPSGKPEAEVVSLVENIYKGGVQRTRKKLGLA